MVVGALYWYDDYYLLLFVDHGNTSGFVGMMDSGYLKRNHIWLNQSPVVLDLACLTGSYNNQKANFAAQNIRRGAMVFMGATDVSYWHTMFNDILYESFIRGSTIGEAYLEARNNEYDENPWNFSLNLKGDIFYALHGDPTFRPRRW